MPQALVVNRSDFSSSQIIELRLPPLAPGYVRLKVESFAVTANNVTYAVNGNQFRYWDFFPASNDWGIVPMWGHAIVEETRCTEIAVGERVYGFLPAATHLDVLPGRISSRAFIDTVAHRQPMSSIYNQYSRLAADPEHDPAYEDQRMIYGPLFKTAFLVERFFSRNDWFGAQTAVISSASSKTALATAYCLKTSSPNIRRIGLTSAGNVEFVISSGLFDKVLAYSAVDSLNRIPAVSIDFAGNESLMLRIHSHLGSALRFSSTVGITHAGVGPAHRYVGVFPGPEPVVFFAPTEAMVMLGEVGHRVFADGVASSWDGFLEAAGQVVTIDREFGLDGARETFAATLAGQVKPSTAKIICMQDPRVLKIA